MNTTETGKEGEEIAEQFLINNGYLIKEKNYHHSKGEIDIIAEAPDGYLVFTEVKYRKNKSYGEPEYSVTLNKQKYIKRTAAAYIFFNELNECPCRFDVIVVTGGGKQPEIVHYIDAFR